MRASAVAAPATASAVLAHLDMHGECLRQRGCSGVSKGVVVLELLEDSVVVMDAVVASSREEGVHGGSLPDMYQPVSGLNIFEGFEWTLDRKCLWTTVVLQHQESVDPPQVLQVVLVFLPVVRERGTLPRGTRSAAGLGHGQRPPTPLGRRRPQRCEDRESRVQTRPRREVNNGDVCSGSQQLLRKTTLLQNFRNLSA